MRKNHSHGNYSRKKLQTGVEISDLSSGLGLDTRFSKLRLSIISNFLCLLTNLRQRYDQPMQFLATHVSIVLVLKVVFYTLPIMIMTDFIHFN